MDVYVFAPDLEEGHISPVVVQDFTQVGITYRGELPRIQGGYYPKIIEYLVLPTFNCANSRWGGSQKSRADAHSSGYYKSLDPPGFWGGTYGGYYPQKQIPTQQMMLSGGKDHRDDLTW